MMNPAKPGVYTLSLTLNINKDVDGKQLQDTIAVTARTAVGDLTRQLMPGQESLFGRVEYANVITQYSYRELNEK